MCKLINNKVFDEGEDLDCMLEGAEFDVDEMMDSPLQIENDGSQERTKRPVKALNAFSTGGLATREGSIGELQGGGPGQAPPLHVYLFLLLRWGWQPVRGGMGNFEEEALARHLLYFSLLCLTSNFLLLFPSVFERIIFYSPPTKDEILPIYPLRITC